MAEVSEVFDDLGENVKKTGKNFKKFLKEHPVAIAIIIVVLIALFVAFRKTGSESTETGGEYYYPSGYGGYPVMENGEPISGGGGGMLGSSSEGSNSSSTVTDSFTSSDLESIHKEWESILNSVTKDYDSVIDEYEDTIYAYNDYLSEYATMAEQQAAAIQYQNVLAQMATNSEMYAQTTDKALKEQLHAENLALADLYGLKFDDKTGNYFYDDGSVVYRSSKQILNNITPVLGSTSSVIDKNYGSIGADSYGNKAKTENLRTYNGITYDVTVDYAAKMQEAYNAGVDYNDPVFQNLVMLRQAKIAGEGLDDTGKKVSATKSTAVYSSGGSSASVSSSVNTSTANKTTTQITYDRNTDYAALINKAKAEGASQEYIDKLTAQRAAKIAGENLNEDGTKK